VPIDFRDVPIGDREVAICAPRVPAERRRFPVAPLVSPVTAPVAEERREVRLSRESVVVFSVLFSASATTRFRGTFSITTRANRPLLEPLRRGLHQ
jgi:hypothetical protein